MTKYTRYHENVFFPKNYEELIEEFRKKISSSGALTFSLHACDKIVKAAQSHGMILWTQTLNVIRGGVFNRGRIFEFYVGRDGNIGKAVVRTELEELLIDLVLVISSNGTIITAYTTKRGDNHESFNKKLYSTE